MKDHGTDPNGSSGFPGFFNAFAKFAGMMGVSYAVLYMVFKLMKIG